MRRIWRRNVELSLRHAHTGNSHYTTKHTIIPQNKANRAAYKNRAHGLSTRPVCLIFIDLSKTIT